MSPLPEQFRALPNGSIPYLEQEIRELTKVTQRVPKAIRRTEEYAKYLTQAYEALLANFRKFEEFKQSGASNIDDLIDLTVIRSGQLLEDAAFDMPNLNPTVIIRIKDDPHGFFCVSVFAESEAERDANIKSYHGGDYTKQGYYDDRTGITYCYVLTNPNNVREKFQINRGLLLASEYLLFCELFYDYLQDTCKQSGFFLPEKGISANLLLAKEREYDVLKRLPKIEGWNTADKYANYYNRLNEQLYWLSVKDEENKDIASTQHSLLTAGLTNNLIKGKLVFGYAQADDQFFRWDYLFETDYDLNGEPVHEQILLDSDNKVLIISYLWAGMGVPRYYVDLQGNILYCYILIGDTTMQILLEGNDWFVLRDIFSEHISTRNPKYKIDWSTHEIYHAGVRDGNADKVQHLRPQPSKWFELMNLR